MTRAFCSLILIAGLTCIAVKAHADDVASPPPMSKHQMMKECMAKQKASDGGIPKEDMKKNCKDVTNTESENEKTEKKQDASEHPADAPQH